MLPSFTVNAYAGVNQQRSDIPHPVLHQQLRKVRELICVKKDLPIYIVAGSKTIDEMAQYLPHSLSELKKISGFGDVKIKQYGQQFLDVIVAYAEANSLMSLIHEKSIKKEPKEKTGPIKKKGDTYVETYKMYKERKSIAEIAEARNLTTGTIETHLSKFVSSGEIKIGELITREKLLIIESAVKEHEGGSITSIKQKVGNDISFGEIRLVMAGLGIN
ncbi:MAG: helix-turn-helix domain-containing protein [Chitinophagaceae bacterium]|nr:helix-turn-helix domain-containing protein [Chitinophagaceae bacterium]